MTEKSQSPRFTELVNSLPASVPFVGPETQERAQGRMFSARLGANENVFGSSPKVIKVIADAAMDTWKYSDPESVELRQALAEHHQISAQNIVIGEGIDGLLGYLVRLMVSPGDRVVTSLGAYPTFNYHVAGYGGELITVPYRGDFEDPEALIAMAQKEKPKLIYFVNPDNPMGTVHSADVVQALIDSVPDECLLILDEAYIECAPDGAAPAFDTNNPNVIRMRTFSKAYGMAGARVGYAIGQVELIRAFDKVRNHFGIPKISQMAALAALQDQEYLSQVVRQINDAKDEIAKIATENGLVPLASATNFVTLDCGGDGDYARRVVAELGALGVFVRMPFVPPQDRCIRISAGTPQDLALLAEVLPTALANAQG
ncbi:histidinol-phosphate aminotransferase [Amylibacter kogurei]|uniref:Histidinol-phosphate aminotransferase n=1 Tax=Paramylibacter kogurei TaxID=1889778 RepID=A0A2G5K1U7_9RHOB|nr:pyridoxal phosphate-dependent aminotransferase [Amylibacter kogurei]PIB23507.1 histidinol-phosphate aminotransferase [Amylibacter kogurei]